MITIKQIKAKILRWKRRRAFNQLTPAWQFIIKYIGDDPDALEKRERKEGK